jgi:hypothetical protein
MPFRCRSARRSRHVHVGMPRALGPVCQSAIHRPLIFSTRRLTNWELKVNGGYYLAEYPNMYRFARITPENNHQSIAVSGGQIWLRPIRDPAQNPMPPVF